MRNKRTLRAIAVLIAIASLVAAISFAGDSPQVREQRVPVHFNSKPDNCDLYVDGKYVGNTEVALRLTPGEHVIEMKLDGYETWRRELWVMNDNGTRVVGRLKVDRAAQ